MSSLFAPTHLLGAASQGNALDVWTASHGRVHGGGCEKHSLRNKGQLQSRSDAHQSQEYSIKGVSLISGLLISACAMLIELIMQAIDGASCVPRHVYFGF